MTDAAGKTMEKVALQLDNGASLNFAGRLFSEASWFDEDSDVLTHQKLYLTEENEQVYSVVKRCGKERSRRAYQIRVEGDLCQVYDGQSNMSLPFDMLMLAVRSLCRLDENATPTLEMVEETLRAANC